MIYAAIFFALSVILLIYGIVLLQRANSIKIKKRVQQEQLDKECEQIKQLSNERTKLEEAIKKEKQNFEDLYDKEKNKLSEQLILYKENVSNSSTNYFNTIEEQYNKIELEYDNKIALLEEEKENAVAALKRIQSSLNAATEAQLREREKEENLQFYKLSLSPIEEEDILKLNSIKLSLHQPMILNKLIWSTYFQKQTTEMCDRILGTKTVCGIYKITDLKTKQCYVGQSTNCQDRWKQHIRHGLGIDASATNKLYNAMQKDNVWNFTFELIEECPREELNEKEKAWIQMFQSDIFGYNTTKGNG